MVREQVDGRHEPPDNKRDSGFGRLEAASDATGRIRGGVGYERWLNEESRTWERSDWAGSEALNVI